MSLTLVLNSLVELLKMVAWILKASDQKLTPNEEPSEAPSLLYYLQE